jgi:hypothetical protein
VRVTFDTDALSDVIAPETSQRGALGNPQPLHPLPQSKKWPDLGSMPPNTGPLFTWRLSSQA